MPNQPARDFNALNGLPPNPINDALKNQFLKRDESQIKLADRIKLYENQGKEFKKIGEMLHQNAVLKDGENKINLEQVKNPVTNSKTTTDNNNQLIKTTTSSNQNNNVVNQNKLSENNIQDPKVISYKNSNFDNNKVINNNNNNNPISRAISERSGTPSDFTPFEKKLPEFKYSPYLAPNLLNASPIATTTQNYFNNATDLKNNATNNNANINNLLSTTSYDQKYKDLKLTSTAQNYLIKFEADNQKKALGLTNIMSTNQLDKYREYLDNIMNNKPANLPNDNTNNAVIKTQEAQRPNGVYTNLVYDTKKQSNQYSISNKNNQSPISSSNNTKTAVNTDNSTTPVKGFSHNNQYYNEPKDYNVKPSNYISSYPESAKINASTYNGLNGQEQGKTQYDLTSAAKPISYGSDFTTDYLKTKNMYNNQDNINFGQFNFANNDSNKNLDAESKKIIYDLRKQIVDSLEKFKNMNSNPESNILGSKLFAILKNLNIQMDGAIDLVEKEGK